MAGSWLSAEPTLLILEGISYYIKREDLMAIFDLPCNQSQAILEYMIHYDQVEPSRREIPIKVFETIATECSLELPIETWDIEEIAKSVPGKVLDRVILCDIEKARMKNDKESHRLFPSPRSGWIEIANIEINDSRNHY
jgi:hypothetical protein